MINIKWTESPEKKHYRAAVSYLSLIYPSAKARKMVKELKREGHAEFKAKDVFRASGLSLLGLSNSYVQEFQTKIRAGIPLAPILLRRDPDHGKVIIADGYHRMCAVYSFHEDAVIHCRIK